MPVVLIVDREEQHAQTMRVVLEARGYEIEHASSGQDALRLLIDEQRPFDLLLIEQALDGVSGRQVARMCKAGRPELKIVFLSIHPGSGGDGSQEIVVHKPCVPQQLAEIVDWALGRRQSTA
jgi:two-component system, cell cycle sensor histidine kinase and response regulator CckA